MVEAIADRLAEAFAERLHEIVRKDLWSYAPDEDLTTEDLLKVKYQGQCRPCRRYIKLCFQCLAALSSHKLCFRHACSCGFATCAAYSCAAHMFGSDITATYATNH